MQVSPLQVSVVRVLGAGPPLVYLPGVDGCGELLFGTAERLAGSFTLACLRYAGEEGGYRELGQGVVRSLGELGVERALLLADSFGVGLALTCALEHPGRVAGLALVNGFARYERKWRVSVARTVAACLPRALYQPCRRRFAWRTLMAPRRDEETLARLLERQGSGFDGAYRARLALARSLDLVGRLGAIRVPAHIFASDHDRIVDAVPAARVLAAHLPDAELTILRDAGHVILPLAEEPWVERLERLAARAGLR